MLAAGILSRPLPAKAQTCFEGKHGPDCRTFWLTETSVQHVLGNPPTGTGNSLGFSSELGHAWNMGPKNAWGATVLFRWADTVTGLGVRARYRRWLGERASLDISPGFRLWAPQWLVGIEVHGGFSGQVALNYSEAIGVCVQADQANATDTTFPASRISELHWYLGVRLGGRAGAAGAIVAAAGTAIVAGASAASQ